MKRKCDRQIILEDGSKYSGFGFGDMQDKILEIVFNTSMVGYQEILSDPSYTDQAVVMTYPLIGNYGMADDGIAGISGVDTRKLNRSIRDYGTRKCLITDINTPLEEGLRKLHSYQMPANAVSRVSSKVIWHSPSQSPASLHVVLIDCGMKKNILRSLNRRGCDVTVVPWNTTSGVICTLKPDGIMISNGPGDPTDVPETIETVRALRGKYPIFSSGSAWDTRSCLSLMAQRPTSLSSAIVAATIR